MTEGSLEDGSYLVRVRAQVMTRDDSKGGWVPMGAGGLSNVSVRKKVLHTEKEPKNEYLIFGRGISDQSVVLSCTIKKDFQYNKVMPTFHHWRTGDKKFGLTFQTAADARAFDKGVRNAVEDLLEDCGDDDVFVTLELPLDSRSSSGSSSASGTFPLKSFPGSGDVNPYNTSPFTHPNVNQQHHMHRMHFIRPARTTQSGLGSNGVTSVTGDAKDIWTKVPNSSDPKKDAMLDSEKIECLPTEPYSYVLFSKDKPFKQEHEYSYPMVDSLKSKRDSITNLKKHLQMPVVNSQPPLLPTKVNKKCKKKDSEKKHSPLTRAQCRYCLDMFNEDENQRGSCEYAPDKTSDCISAVSCIYCAQCMLYHCMSDTEGDFSHPPCSCDSSDEHCHRRWAGLSFLSLFVPCLWCYPPLRACHGCGVHWGVCGGRHEAM